MSDFTVNFNYVIEVHENLVRDKKNLISYT